MAIKINGVDVIDDDRRGIFKIKSRCLYNIPDRISEWSFWGEIVYDGDQQKLFVYNGSAWTNVGVVENTITHSSSIYYMPKLILS